MAKKRKKETKIDEFRKERTKEAKGHPRHFFKKRGKKYFGLGITHAEYTNGKRNVPLQKNPEPKSKDKRPTYIRVKIEELDEDRLSAKLKSWEFGGSDAEMVRELEKILDTQMKERKKEKLNAERKAGKDRKGGKK